MKQVCGIWLPDSEEHLVTEITREQNPFIQGKATYQLNKYMAALEHTIGRNHAMDVGANVGLWSRVMVRNFAFVTALEPIAEHRACFDRNVVGADLLPYAVGSEPGHICINVPAANVGSAHVSPDGEWVEVITLDSLRIGPVDFIKIDIEGFEYEAIVGGEQLIRTSRPTMIVEQKRDNAERYGRGQWDAVSLLKDWGMREVKVIGGDHVMVFD